MTYSSHCLPKTDTDLGDVAFDLALLFTKELFAEQGYTVEVTLARQLGEDQIFVTTSTTILGNTIPGDSLVIYEDGRWVDSSCEEGRFAAGLTEIPGSGAEDFPQPSLPEFYFPVLGSDPSEHTLEEVARSAEANFGRTIVAGVMDTTYTEEAQALFTHDCREGLGAESNDSEGSLSQESFAALVAVLVDLRVTGVSRVDASQAWVELNLTAPFGPPSPALIQLFAFEDGRWLNAGCRQEPDGDLVPPEDIQDILRVSYIGETVQVQNDYEDAPFAVTVLGEPEIIDESFARVPARFTSIVERWVFESYFHISGYMALPNGDGGTQIWETETCEGNSALESVELVKGGWFDGYICLIPEDQSYQYGWAVTPARPNSWLEYKYYSEESDPEPLIVDLTRTVEATESIRFAHGVPDGPIQGISPLVRHIEWWEEESWPAGAVGDKITVLDFQDVPYFTVTVLSEPEVYNSTTARFRLALSLIFPSLYRDDLDIHYLGIELTTAPDEQGRLGETWWTTTTDESGSALPDSFHNVTLNSGESHEGWAYFTVPEGETLSEDTLPSILWVQAQEYAYVRVNLNS